MSKADVKTFNIVCGNAPSQGTLYEVWKQLKAQASFIKSEAEELCEGIEAENMENVIKEYADVKYTLAYMEQLLEAFGVNTRSAFEAVCQNNNQKFTRSYSYTKESQERLEEKGVECYIETTVYEGETYYTVRRSSDGKVLKPYLFEDLNLAHLTPKEFQ